MSLILKLAKVFLILLRILIIFCILLVLFGIIVPYIQDLKSFSYFIPLIKLESSINHSIKTTLPTMIGGRDTSRIITLVGLIILLEIVKYLYAHINIFIQKNNFNKELHLLKQNYRSTADKDKIETLENKIKNVKLSNKTNRRELLNDFINLKKELEKVGRDLAFLAIDVVDSTGMKIAEDPTIIERDFLEYHDFIESKFNEFGVIRAAWTPDGVMGCFNSVDDAIRAAQAILTDLDNFNQNVKMMKHDFVLRCGINAGRVYYDDTIPLEHFSDRVIDIAGHMQKYAKPNSIFISKNIVEPVSSFKEFNASDTIVDGLEVCQWQAKVN